MKTNEDIPYIKKDEFREKIEKYYLHEEKDYKCAACGEGTLWLAQANAYVKGFRDAKRMAIQLINDLEK